VRIFTGDLRIDCAVRRDATVLGEEEVGEASG
jgi:hypothetical protein